jgi:hypothetical protein
MDVVGVDAHGRPYARAGPFDETHRPSGGRTVGAHNDESYPLGARATQNRLRIGCEGSELEVAVGIDEAHHGFTW